MGLKIESEYVSVYIKIDSSWNATLLTGWQFPIVIAFKNIRPYFAGNDIHHPDSTAQGISKFPLADNFQLQELAKEGR